MFTPLKYNKTYEYPPWGYAIGIFLALSSVVITPLTGLFLIAKTQGTIKQVCTVQYDTLDLSSQKHFYVPH